MTVLAEARQTPARSRAEAQPSTEVAKELVTKGDLHTAIHEALKTVVKPAGEQVVNHIHGRIDDVKLFNRALSADEVAALPTRGACA